jgi:hypothetical protein
MEVLLFHVGGDDLVFEAVALEHVVCHVSVAQVLECAERGRSSDKRCAVGVELRKEPGPAVELLFRIVELVADERRRDDDLTDRTSGASGSAVWTERT